MKFNWNLEDKKLVGNFYRIRIFGAICCPDVYSWRMETKEPSFGHWSFSACQHGFESVEEAMLNAESFLVHNIDRISSCEPEWKAIIVAMEKE